MTGLSADRTKSVRILADWTVSYRGRAATTGALSSAVAHAIVVPAGFAVVAVEPGAALRRKCLFRPTRF